jgi:hypothetical protein
MEKVINKAIIACMEHGTVDMGTYDELRKKKRV